MVAIITQPNKFYFIVLDVNSVADLLKRYMRELPEPLISGLACGSLEKALHIEDQESKLAALREIVSI